MRKYIFFLLISTLLLGAGCATQVRVRTEPPGADVMARGSGRTAYRWENRGRAPVEFKVYYTAIQTVAVWPDGRKSPVTRTKLIGKKDVDLLLQPETEQ